MDTYFTGQVLRITVEFHDNDEVPTDPSSIGFSFRIDQGDVTTYTYGVGEEIQRNGTGVYYVDLDLATAGTWAYEFMGSGTIENAIEDAFLVVTALAIHPLVELQEAKAYLRVTERDEDAMLFAMLCGIESTLKENLSGYIVAQEASVYLDGGRETLQIPRVPVSTAEGEEITVHDDIWDVDVDSEFYRLIPTTGQIFYKNEAGLWPEGRKRYIVTYTSGLSLRDDYTELIKRIKLAELTWLADIYYNRGASTSKETIDEVTQWYDMTHELPKNVRRLLQGLLDVYSDM